jgi:hypothetical protein
MMSDAQVIMNKCHYCKQQKPSGQWRVGYWVCHTCFPAEGGLVQIRKCDACGARNQMGAVVGNKFICTGCNAFIGAAQKPHFSKKKKKKKCQPVCFKIGEQPVQQTKKRKPKKITRYKVVIVEISYGEL